MKVSGNCNYCKFYNKFVRTCYRFGTEFKVNFNNCSLFVHYNSKTNETDFARFLRLNRNLPF